MKVSFGYVVVDVLKAVKFEENVLSDQKWARTLNGFSFLFYFLPWQDFFLDGIPLQFVSALHYLLFLLLHIYTMCDSFEKSKQIHALFLRDVFLMHNYNIVFSRVLFFLPVNHFRIKKIFLVRHFERKFSYLRGKNCIFLRWDYWVLFYVPRIYRR